jgi:RecJ-like exonuclease
MQEQSPDRPFSEEEPKTCPECAGRGWVDNRCLTPDHAHRCPICNGRGFDTAEKECYACRGTGLLELRQEDKNPCPLCGGAGIFPVPESMRARDFAFNPGRRTM